MAEWLDTPLIVMAVLAVGGLFWKAARWTAKVDSDRNAFGKMLATIQDDIKKILGRLPPTAVESGSPLRLTDFGRVLAEDLGADAWADATAPGLMEQVRDKEPFEVDDFCENYVASDLDAAMRRRVAVTAFDHGMSRDRVAPVLRVVLRDKLLSLMAAGRK